jgi:hypothetical protein
MSTNPYCRNTDHRYACCEGKQLLCTPYAEPDPTPVPLPDTDAFDQWGRPTATGLRSAIQNSPSSAIREAMALLSDTELDVLFAYAQTERTARREQANPQPLAVTRFLERTDPSTR